MIFLGIETSCDETSVAVYDSYKGIKSSIISSQIDIHSRYGGVVPEIASRNHALKMETVFYEALEKASISVNKIDAVGVTRAPGLIGALFVGVSFAKGLSYSLKVPLIPVNHLAAHLISAELTHPELTPPYTGLIISGGHSHIYQVDKSYNFRLFSHTVDDAAGEAFDKVAKMMGLPYPGGPAIENLSQNGNPDAVNFPVAMKAQNNMSFSGLKTAVLNCLNGNKENITNADIAASFQDTLVETLINKSQKALKHFKSDKLVISGGVACNGYLRDKFHEYFKGSCNIYFPSKYLCTDNGDMIAYAAYKFMRLRKFLDIKGTARDNESSINTII